MRNLLLASMVLTASWALADEPITRIWLTHRASTPDKLMVNWHTDQPANSLVEFGSTGSLGQKVFSDEAVKLHHVEIPMTMGSPLYYRVKSGGRQSATWRVAGYPADEMRIVVVADTGYMRRPWGELVSKDKPHLLASAGDNVPSLHPGVEQAPRDSVVAYLQLIDRAPALYATTPFLPALGNHDHEFRSRGTKYPAEPTYDIDATAFKLFFPLPDDGWKWRFDLPDFGVRLVALDIHHLGDFGTTWQTCHSYKEGSEQFNWYKQIMQDSRQPYLITISNEKSSTLRGLEKGQWTNMITRGSLSITGFGYFAERAVTDDGFNWYNTSVNGTGDKYPDPKSAVLKSQDNYILLTLRKGKDLVVEVKSLDGEVLDRKEYAPRVLRD